MNRSGVFQFVYFFIYVLVQVLVLKDLVLFHAAFCFLYIMFILLLPIETNNLVLLLVAFALGFVVDVFYDSLGMHACAAVVIAYVRNYWLATITPQGGYDAGAMPTLANNGIQWFVVYTLPLLFLHHTILFFIEASGFSQFWFTMLKIMSSLLFTLLVVVLLQYLSFSRRRS